MLGRHDGVIGFTVGQRRGLHIGGGEALYVLRIEPDTRRVVVGPKAALARRTVQLSGVNWLGGPTDADGTGIEVEVKLRSAQPPVPATIFRNGGDAVRVELHAPELGVAPGQACVFYAAERVLGGGWIQRQAVALAA